MPCHAPLARRRPSNHSGIFAQRDKQIIIATNLKSQDTRAEQVELRALDHVLLLDGLCYSAVLLENLLARLGRHVAALWRVDGLFDLGTGWRRDVSADDVIH